MGRLAKIFLQEENGENLLLHGGRGAEARARHAKRKELCGRCATRMGPAFLTISVFVAMVVSVLSDYQGAETASEKTISALVKRKP